jgi:hypothetical protein
VTEHGRPPRVHTRRGPTSGRSEGAHTATDTATLFAMAKTRSKPQRPSTRGGPEKRWHRCSMEPSLSHTEISPVLPLVTSNDGPRDSYTW